MSSKFSHPPLSILFRDDWVVAVDKPAGQLVHPSDTPAEEDLVTMKLLRDQIEQRVYPIHRLDRPTSGVLVFAIDREVAASLHAAFERNEIEKVYWAVVEGHPTAEDWICHDPIEDRAAETSFRVLATLAGPLALVEARPKTGRFHQIRRHLLAAGHPIIGDYRYAGIERSDEWGAKLDTGTRMLLQAKCLRLRHPVTGEALLIEAPLDPVMARVFGHHN
jgi:tRNA pseudouridine65 synthase